MAQKLNTTESAAVAGEVSCTDSRRTQNLKTLHGSRRKLKTLMLWDCEHADGYMSRHAKRNVCRPLLIARVLTLSFQQVMSVTCYAASKIASNSPSEPPAMELLPAPRVPPALAATQSLRSAPRATAPTAPAAPTARGWRLPLALAAAVRARRPPRSARAGGRDADEEGAKRELLLCTAGGTRFGASQENRRKAATRAGDDSKTTSGEFWRTTVR